MTLARLGVALLAGVWAGTQNAMAGGGSFITLPALLFAGLDARAANITSTVALFPGQVATGLAGRRLVLDAPALRFRWLAAISLAGGALGALLLLATPSAFFNRLVPWLVLFATTMFALGSLRRGRSGDATPEAPRIGRVGAVVMQAAISVYGGYFGGGIGFLMLAALTMAGMALRGANASKNALAGMMNASAVVVLVASPAVAWGPAAALATGAIGGGLLGARLAARVNERALRITVIAIGAGLTVAMFLRAR